jgi:hypothetical protein
MVSCAPTGGGFQMTWSATFAGGSGWTFYGAHQGEIGQDQVTTIGSPGAGQPSTYDTNIGFFQIFDSADARSATIAFPSSLVLHVHCAA